MQAHQPSRTVAGWLLGVCVCGGGGGGAVLTGEAVYKPTKQTSPTPNLATPLSWLDIISWYTSKAVEFWQNYNFDEFPVAQTSKKAQNTGLKA